MRHVKDIAVQIKAGPDDGLEEGEFLAYASVFGNKDSYGDVVVPGAFAGTLERWAAKSNAFIPLLFGHNMSDPDFNIGHVDAKEDDHGLLVHAYIDLEAPKGASTYRAIKGGRLNQMSFAYDVLDGGSVTRDGDDFYELRELELFEVSVVTVGANQETEILAVKALAEAIVENAKAGRVLSAKNETTLRGAVETIDSAADALKNVLAQLEADEDPEKTHGQVEVKAEEPSGAKAQEPGVSPAVRTRWQTEITTSYLV